MKKQTLLLASTLLAVAGTLFMTSTRASVSISGDPAPAAAPTSKIDATDPAIQAIVRDEVAKQLQPAVQKEVRRQFDVILYRAQQEQIARADAQQKAMRANSTMAILQTLRSQLELYKIQHIDLPPKLAEMQDWRALLQKTNALGNYDDHPKFGPYLQSAPVNPFNNQTAIVPAGRASMDAGWTYNDKTGELRAILPAAIANQYKGKLPDDFEVAN